MSAKILIVDDYPDAREWLKAVLGVEGYTTIQAADGKEAIEMTWLHLPDLILMDLGLPVMNGLEATIALRSDPDTAHIPIIAVTAHYNLHPELRQRYFNEFIDKPVDVTKLEKTISTVLSTKPASTG
jgi:two-component system cell cycle response regulator DivK